MVSLADSTLKGLNVNKSVFLHNTGTTHSPATNISKITVKIKFGVELNLAVWWSNQNPLKYFTRDAYNIYTYHYGNPVPNRQM
jgi:hypothetical protein